MNQEFNLVHVLERALGAANDYYADKANDHASAERRDRYRKEHRKAMSTVLCLIKAASTAEQTLANILPELPDGFLVDVCVHDSKILRAALAKVSP
jgi:hypothetical protein